MSCSDVQNLINSQGFLASVAAQAVASFLSIIVCSIVAWQSRNLYFHINCKILIIAMLLLYIVHSIFIAALQTMQLIRYFTITDPCQVGLPPIVCVCIRTPASVCMISFSLFQFMLIVERAVALWKHQHYGTYGPQLGYISTFLCLLISMAAITWVLEEADLNERQAFCSAATTRTKERVELICFIMCGINITTLVGLIVLTMFNKSAKKRRRFNLHSSYQIRENADVLDIMLPLSIFETLCYAAFTFSNGIITMFQKQLSTVAYRTLFTATYLVPFYTLISPTILWFIIKRLRKMKVVRLEKITTAVKDEKEAYFNMYTQMWSQAVAGKVAPFQDSNESKTANYC